MRVHAPAWSGKSESAVELCSWCRWARSRSVGRPRGYGFAGDGLCDARGGAGASFDYCGYTRPCCVVASQHGRASDSVVGATFALGRDVAAGPLVQCFSEADRGRVSRHTKCPPDPAQLRWPEHPRARGDCSSPSTAPQREMELLPMLRCHDSVCQTDLVSPIIIGVFLSPAQFTDLSSR